MNKRDGLIEIEIEEENMGSVSATFVLVGHESKEKSEKEL